MAALALLALGLAACGASGAKPMRIEFGLSGGNVVPIDAVISPQGMIDWIGPYRQSRRHLSISEARLSTLVRTRLPKLSSRQCPGTLPDVASRFIRADGRAVRVHGNCEPGMDRLWNQLALAVGLSAMP